MTVAAGHLATITTITETWITTAACRGINPDLFFPARGEDTTAAKAVCRGCPVRLDCLRHALNNGEHFGVWGGTSERERRQLRKKLAVKRQRRTR